MWVVEGWGGGVESYAPRLMRKAAPVSEIICGCAPEAPVIGRGRLQRAWQPGREIQSHHIRSRDSQINAGDTGTLDPVQALGGFRPFIFGGAETLGLLGFIRRWRPFRTCDAPTLNRYLMAQAA